MGFPGGSVVKESAYNAEDVGRAGLIPGSGVSPGGGPPGFWPGESPGQSLAGRVRHDRTD